MLIFYTAVRTWELWGGVVYVASLLIPPFSSRLVTVVLNPLLVVLVECCVGE